MATLDGKEIPICVHCTRAKEDARERTVTKGDAQMNRVLCDDCAEKVGAVYDVKPIGRKTARAADEADRKTDGDGSPAAETSSRSKRTEE